MTTTCQVLEPQCDTVPLTSVADATEANAASGQLRMEVIHDINDIPFGAVDSWTRLTDNPMATPQWLLPWWKHYSSANDELQLILFFDQQQLVSVVPLYLENSGDLKLLGSGKVCSDHSELLIGDIDSVQRATPLLLEWLVGDESPNWRCLYLEAIDGFSQTAAIAKDWGKQLPAWNQTGDPICTIEMPDDWEQYVASLSKNHRKRVRRWSRQHLESEEVQVRSTASGWNLEEAFECLVYLHNLRRSDLPETGAFECECFLEFHREAFTGLALQGQAVISALFVDDKPVAIEYELCNDDTMFAYQSGVDTESGLSSPGSVSILARLRSAVASGKKTYDLMRGNESYKSHWKAQGEPTQNITIWPRNFAGTSSRLKFHSKRKLRTAVRFVKAKWKKDSK